MRTGIGSGLFSHRHLLAQQLQEAEEFQLKLLRLLPCMAFRATDQRLVALLDRRVGQIYQQHASLGEMRRQLLLPELAGAAVGIAGLICETVDILSTPGDSAVVDHAINVQARRLLRYESVGLEAAATTALALGNPVIADKLTTMVSALRNMDVTLQAHASGNLNCFFN